jgi:hypothetical protein
MQLAMGNKQFSTVRFLCLLPIAYYRLVNCCNYTIITKRWQLIFYKKALKTSVSKSYTCCIINERLRSFISYKCLLTNCPETGILITLPAMGFYVLLAQL